MNGELEALRDLLSRRRQLQPQLRNALQRGRLESDEIHYLHREITTTLGGYVATIIRTLPGFREADPWFIWPGYRWLSDESKGPQRYDIRGLSEAQTGSEPSLHELSERHVGYGTRRGAKEISTVLPLVLWM